MSDQFSGSASGAVSGVASGAMRDATNTEPQFIDAATFASRVLSVTVPKKHDDIQDGLHSTLAQTSYDTHHQVGMVVSDHDAVNFDKIAEITCRAASYNAHVKQPRVPRSPDALIVDDQRREWYFIEFKNGRVTEMEVSQKMYDAILLSLDVHIVPDRSFFNKFATFILVYNPERLNDRQIARYNAHFGGEYKPRPCDQTGRIQTQAYFKDLAEEDFDPFGIAKLKGYLFRDVVVQTQRRFARTHAAEWGTRMPKRRPAESVAADASGAQTS
ncbi:hypothetical protein DSM100688_0553 [Bifidobacterium ramosum]|uniref:Uncharacterized protein n=1 Tax=Bifidobacterium ramosum TaxID=1798158 RepID=A0A6L4X270_9BIFI|nr:hypothetical protein [Bifidobacterium ramosum]KAB8288551.1 hypothetical protein DSM100688_0553 [Bifidobacterium ramosum]NEG71755.1 hypothetical protein [Bifidobacterium ramosum]